MQIRTERLSQLRKNLTEVFNLPSSLLSSLLSGEPFIKGTLYPLRRKCSKASCRCVRGQLHSRVVLTASLSGKTKLWTIPLDRLQEIRECTKAYHEFRQAQRGLLKEIDRRRKQMQSVIAAIEKIRLRQP